MNTIRATWKDGQIVPDGPISWPDGSRLVIHPELVPEIEFMTEDEQADDPESIARWIAAFDAIPLLPMTSQEEADMIAWREKVRAFNIEAVRRQMEEGIP